LRQAYFKRIFVDDSSSAIGELAEPFDLLFSREVRDAVSGADVIYHPVGGEVAADALLALGSLGHQQSTAASCGGRSSNPVS